MELKDIVAVSGKEGLFKVYGRRDDGMICESMLDGKRGFISSRQHMFSPLEGITVYTDSEPVELKKVFEAMLNNEATQALPDAKADGAALRAYFKIIVPAHDEEKVYTSDIKKIIKWYALLKDKGLMVFSAEEDKAEEKTEGDEVKEVKAKAPKKDSAEKKHKAEAKSTKAAPARAKAPVKKVVTPRKAS